MTKMNENLELYRIMVETVSANEARRQQVNSVFITLLAAGSATYGSSPNSELVFFTAPAFLISLIWYAKVKYFKELASAKFKVIGNLEKSFDVQPFTEEWRFMGFGAKEDVKEKTEEFNHSLGFRLTDLELLLPKVIGFLSAIHIVVWLLNLSR